MENEMPANSERSISLIAIRPILDLSKEVVENDNLAAFQFHVLRPILKLQHDFFLWLAETKLIVTHPDWKFYSDQRKRELISSWVSKDLNIKKLIEGSIISLMTIEELRFYQLNEKEIQKRLKAFVIERLRLAL